MPFGDVNGTTIFYTEVGSDRAGPALLLMHGGPGFDHSCFRPAFDRMSTNSRVIYYDHRCNGRSGRPPIETFTIEQAADDAAGLLDHLKIARAVVCGHSYGGFIAQEFALRHPDRLAGLVLVDTTPGQIGTAEDPDADQGPPPPAAFIEAISSVPTSDAEFAAMAPTMMPYYLHRLSWADIEPVLGDTIFSVDAMVRGMQVLASWSSVDRLDQIEAPCLLLAGRHDIPTSWQQSERIARRVPHADLVILEGSGHFPWLEEPDRFFEVLTSWLNEGPAAAS